MYWEGSTPREPGEGRDRRGAKSSIRPPVGLLSASENRGSEVIKGNVELWSLLRKEEKILCPVERDRGPTIRRALESNPQNSYHIQNERELPPGVLWAISTKVHVENN